MSTLKCNSSIRECSTPSVTRFTETMELPETLADYVSRIRQEKRLSLNDVVRQSGNQIANSHVSRIENGFTTNVTTDKLRALAKGLGVPEEEIFAVARGKSVTGDLQLDELKLLEYFRVLPAESREILLAYAEMMSARTSAKGRRVPGVAKGVSVLQEKEKKRA
jgi:transcriptional regulator with XRE-family HTH domain